MKVVVISLKSSLGRRKASEKRLVALGISFEYLDAVNGRDNEHSLLTRVDEREFLLNYGRNSLSGEIGCYASHLLAWEKCVKSGEKTIIFEDDFVLEKSFIDVMQKVDKLDVKYGFIRLEKTNKKPQFTVKQDGDYSLIKYLKVPQCLTCYVISPAVAKELIKNSKIFTCPVDVFVRNVAMHKQTIYGLEPYMCRPGQEFESEIGIRYRSQQKTLFMRLRIIIRKVKNTIKNGLEHFRQSIILLLTHLRKRKSL